MIDDDGRVVHEVDFAHPVEQVWAAIVDPAALGSWLMANDFEPRVGHRFQFDAGPPRGPIDAEVLALDPPHRIEWRWMLDDVPTIVTITLRAAGRGTRLLLVHADIPPTTRPDFETGWVDKFNDLRAVLKEQT